MKKLYAFVLPVLLGLGNVHSGSASVTTPPLSTMTTDAEEQTPAQLATEFFDGSIIQASTNGEYQWYKLKASKRGMYCILLDYSSKAKVKVTADGNAPISSLEDVELVKDVELYSLKTPAVKVDAGEYLYFGISNTESESVYYHFEEEKLTYDFGEPVVTPANGSEVENLSSLVISYPDAQTNDENARLGLANENSSTGASFIPAQLFEGKLDATYGAIAIGTADIFFKQEESKPAELNISFEQDIKPDTWYTISIPENVVAFCNELFGNSGIWVPIQNVPQTKGFLLHYKGKGIPKLNFTGCAIQEKDTVSTLGIVPFWFDKEVKAAEGAQVELRTKDQTVKAAALEIIGKQGESLVWADFTDDTHAAFALEDSAAYTLVLPAGSLSTTDGALSNEEVSIAFSGPIYKADTVEVTVEVPVDPEMTTITYKIGDYVASVFKAPKNKSITVDLTPEEGWKVTGLMLNDLDVLPDYKEPTYTSPALFWDEVTLAAALSYEGFTYTEDANGIASVEGSNLKAYSQDGKIIVTGVPAGETVKVYSLGGSLLGAYTATEDKSEITVPAGGKVYIVKVGSYALKLTNR